jgi:hypothetical protein
VSTTLRGRRRDDDGVGRTGDVEAAVVVVVVDGTLPEVVAVDDTDEAASTSERVAVVVVDDEDDDDDDAFTLEVLLPNVLVANLRGCNRDTKDEVKVVAGAATADNDVADVAVVVVTVRVTFMALERVAFIRSTALSFLVTVESELFRTAASYANRQARFSKFSIFSTESSDFRERSNDRHDEQFEWKHTHDDITQNENKAMRMQIFVSDQQRAPTDMLNC